MSCHRRRSSNATRRAARLLANQWVIALTVTMATFMEVLDTSIANVSLPHIAGNLSVSTNESTWVLTSYLVANAIVLPLSGWLSSILGRKRFYMMCVLMFTISSMLCGLATSLGQLIFFRVLQGIGGGGLQPSEQAILVDTFPPQKRGMAMAVYGMAILVAPVLGPTLGGWITDNYSWRWIFFINVPVGCLSLILEQHRAARSAASDRETGRAAEEEIPDRLHRPEPARRLGSARSKSCSTRGRRSIGSARAMIVWMWRSWPWCRSWRS